MIVVRTGETLEPAKACEKQAGGKIAADLLLVVGVQPKLVIVVVAAQVENAAPKPDAAALELVLVQVERAALLLVAGWH